MCFYGYIYNETFWVCQNHIYMGAFDKKKIRTSKIPPKIILFKEFTYFRNIPVYGCQYIQYKQEKLK